MDKSNLFQLTPSHKYYEYWKPVERLDTEPDEYQKEMIRLVGIAIDSGIFYSSDLLDWVKENNDFIPVEAWEWQYKNTLVEGGLMGMEIFSARKALEEIRRQDAIVDGGYVPVTEEFIEKAFQMKKKVEIFGYKTIYNPRNIGGKFYLMKPHMQKWALQNDGQFGRFVEK